MSWRVGSPTDATRWGLLLGVVVAVANTSPAAAAAIGDVEFSWRGTDNVRLAGELLLPPGRGPHPAVIMLHGSGPATREDFRRQARFLARRGVAALIFDKRGSGSSGGDGYRYAELAADASAAVRALVRRPEIRDRAIGLWGLSEGAFICPRVAARNQDVAAVVTVSGPAMTPVRQQDWAVHNALLVAGAGEIATRPVTTLYRLSANTDPDFRSNPGRWWRKVAQPVLAVWGSDDELVPIRESARALRAYLQAAPNTDRTFRTFAGADHGLTVGVRGRNAIYAPGFLQLAVHWLRQRLNDRADPHVVDTPLPRANGVTVTRAIEPPAWHGTPAAQIAWAALVLAASLLAPGLRSGIPTRNVVAIDTLALLSLPAGLALIIAEDGQGIPTLGGYPLPLWPAVALTAASVVVTAWLIVAHTAGATATRQRVTLATLAAASALLFALMAYWPL